jgi:hypothetical protein
MKKLNFKDWAKGAQPQDAKPTNRKNNDTPTSGFITKIFCKNLLKRLS